MSTYRAKWCWLVDLGRVVFTLSHQQLRSSAAHLTEIHRPAVGEHRHKTYPHLNAGSHSIDYCTEEEQVITERYSVHHVIARGLSLNLAPGHECTRQSYTQNNLSQADYSPLVCIKTLTFNTVKIQVYKYFNSFSWSFTKAPIPFHQNSWIFHNWWLFSSMLLWYIDLSVHAVISQMHACRKILVHWITIWELQCDLQDLSKQASIYNADKCSSTL